MKIGLGQMEKTVALGYPLFGASRTHHKCSSLARLPLIVMNDLFWCNPIMSRPVKNVVFGA
jgi:hypothetical protein